MSQIATTKMSSKGQVVIPEPIRKRLKLKTGAKFVVMSDETEDVVILKRITPPSLDEFDDLIAQARLAAAKVGLTETDIQQAIQKVRSHDASRT